MEDLTVPRVIKSATEHFSVTVKGGDTSAYSELFAQLAVQIGRAVPQQ